MSGNRTNYDKNYSQFYDNLSQNASSFFDKKQQTKENYYNNQSELIKKQKMTIEQHRTDYDKNYKAFYDKLSFTAKTYPYEKANVDASGNVMDASGNVM